MDTISGRNDKICCWQQIYVDSSHLFCFTTRKTFTVFVWFQASILKKEGVVVQVASSFHFSISRGVWDMQNDHVVDWELCEVFCWLLQEKNQIQNLSFKSASKVYEIHILEHQGCVKAISSLRVNPLLTGLVTCLDRQLFALFMLGIQNIKGTFNLVA